MTIQTLKDFQYTEEGKDQGQNVREKAKQLVALLNDEERFKNERTKALTAKERYALNTGVTVCSDIDLLFVLLLSFFIIYWTISSINLS